MKTQVFSAIVIGVTWIVSYNISSAQAYLKKLDPAEYKNNFKDLSRQVNMFYDTAVGSNRSGYKQWKRYEWMALNHLDQNGAAVNVTSHNEQAIKEMNRMTAHTSRMPATGEWFNLGHSFIPGAEAKMGRVNSIAFDPVDSGIAYIATAGGGIWKTFNEGDSWINLTIDLPVLGIADIVVCPAPDNHILYALTGDVTGTSNTYVHSTVGVIKSYNGGASWVRTNYLVPLSQDRRGYKLLMHPTNSNILLAATNYGIIRTENGGITWDTMVINNNVNDIEFDLNNLDSVYFAVRNSPILRRLSLTTELTTNHTVTGTVDRMEIAVTPDNPKAVYVLCGPGFLNGTVNQFAGLFYSANCGASFTMRSNVCNNNGDLFNSGNNLSWYANVIYADPLEENNVIAGGLNLFGSVNGGQTLNQITTNSIHADQHNIKRNPLNGVLWLCNDGGIYRSTDNGINWDNKSNGLIINEYYRISGTNNEDDLLLGGTQDNGHFLMNTAEEFTWVMDGDGMDNYFNSWDNSIAYACSQNGGLRRSIWGGPFANTTLPNRGNRLFYPWIAPIVQQPPWFDSGSFQWLDTDFIYVYSLNGIMRGEGGDAWVNIGPPGTGSNGPSPATAIGRDENGTKMYMSNGSRLWRTSNPMDANPAWDTCLLPNLNGGFISAIAVNPINKFEIWIVITGYIAGTKVFRSQNEGVTWSNLSLSLPNVPVYSIVFANAYNSPSGSVYIGTEIGVFYTDDNIPDWVPFSNGLPHVPVTDLLMNYVTNELKAATYGRGIWQSVVYESCSPLVLVDSEIDQGQFNFESSNEIYAYKSILGGIGTRVTMKAASRVKLLNGFRAYPDSYVRIKIGPCGSGPIGMAINSDNTNVEKPKEFTKAIQ